MNPVADDAGGPTAPTRPDLPANATTELRDRVADAILALPGYFTSQTTIEGLQATDLFSLNSVLGATIEIQVVETLNRMRDTWDPDDEWQVYSFERQPQTFPDVRLVARDGDGVHVALGIELKGWYLLAKESEPSLRYKVTPSACADHDLIVVVPWYLSNVLAGTPIATTPWVESARFAAEYRNYWWSHIRTTNSDPGVDPPDGGAQPYPAKDQQISDTPRKDGGGNFGRLARIDALMGDWVKDSLEAPVAGIPANDWVMFFRAYAERSDPASIRARLEAKYAAATNDGTEAGSARIVELLDELVDLLG